MPTPPSLACIIAFVIKPRSVVSGEPVVEAKEFPAPSLQFAETVPAILPVSHAVTFAFSAESVASVAAPVGRGKLLAETGSGFVILVLIALSVASVAAPLGNGRAEAETGRGFVILASIEESVASVAAPVGSGRLLTEVGSGFVILVLIAERVASVAAPLGSGRAAASIGMGFASVIGEEAPSSPLSSFMYGIWTPEPTSSLL